MKSISCTQAKQIDLVEYLQSLGHIPIKIRGNDYWYLSPLRDEKTASFKVDRKLNLWYDHGNGQGGDLVDFGTLYFNCSVSSLLSRLAGQAYGKSFSFHPPTIGSAKPSALPAGEKKGAIEGKIAIHSCREIVDWQLIDYLKSRCVPLEVASRFCKEVDFSLYGKAYKAIGFANNAGGYELRSKDFKGSSSPKNITFVDNKNNQLVVFEGFFNFLSYVSLYGNNGKPQPNYLVLNSLAFFQKSIPLMQQHETVILYLDRDAAGMKCTEQALQISPRFKDDSYLYEQYKDLNQFLINQPLQKPEKNLPNDVSELRRLPRELLPSKGKGRSI